MARDVAARLAALGDFADVAGALRAIAAGNLQQADAIRAAARDYAKRLDTASDAALGPDNGATTRPALTVAFVAEHGFCAAFDRPILAALDGATSVLLVGRSGTRRAREMGVVFDAHLAMAAHPAGLDDCVAGIAAHCRAARSHGSVRLLAMRTEGGHTQIAARALGATRTLRPDESATLRNLAPAVLAASLADETLYAAIFLSAVESFATENTARFARMDGACRRARDMGDELLLAANRERQDAISAEIADIYAARPRQAAL
jgi:F0F1-type ATP synthase gamma subunit